MIVVADASPLICLERIGRLALLPGLFGSVLIPPTVLEEILMGPDGPGLVGRSPWLEVRAILDGHRVDELAAGLDPGEAAAIALAVE